MNIDELYYSRTHGIVERIIDASEIGDDKPTVSIFRKVGGQKGYWFVPLSQWNQWIDRDDTVIPINNLKVIVPISGDVNMELVPTINSTNGNPVLTLTVNLDEIGYGDGWSENNLLTLEADLNQSTLYFKLVDVPQVVHVKQLLQETGMDVNKLVRDYINTLFKNAEFKTRT